MSALYYLDSANILNRGASANDNTGDTLRTAALKINTNFQMLDSALNAGGGGGAGTSSTFEFALNLLDSTGRGGTILSSPLHVGDAVYFDYDANVWTGAYADSAHVASHVIVSRNTAGSTFEVAQTGVFNLESDGNPVNTLSPHFWYHLPSTSGAFPSTSVDSAVGQILYYALDSDSIDLNIGEPRLTAAEIQYSEQLPAISGGQTVLSSLLPINTNVVDVFKNGVLLFEGAGNDYVVNSTTQITLNDALDDSDLISVRSNVAATVAQNTIAADITGTTAGTPSPAVNGDGDTGLFSDAANTLNVSAGGSEVASFTTAGLDVTGTLSVGGADVTDTASAEFDLVNTVSGNYTFSGDGFPSNVSDPVLHLSRGETYRFINVPGSHPLEIRSSAGGSAYSDGVTNNGGTGTVTFTVPMDAPNKLYYQCTSHASMLGTIYIDEIISLDSDLVLTGGVGVPNTTTLSGIGAVTYTLTDGNTASLTTDSNKTITFDGTWSGIVGSGFSLMIKNSDADSDRTMTFEAGTGKTVKFNSANTLTLNANDFGVASVLVFDANTILVTATSLDSSLTF